MTDELAPVPVAPRRLAFLGTPEAAVAPLRALVDGGFDVALVVTRADKRRGRGGALSPSPVKAAALELGLPVSHRVADVLEVGAELGVVVAYGALIRRPVLERLAMINVHFSLLPRWRGAAPLGRALLAGDAVPGVCIMQLEEPLDGGRVFARHVVPVDERDTLDSLRTRLVAAGSGLLVATLRAGLRDPEPQDGEVTYAAKLEAADRRLDWSRPAIELDRVVRVGGAHTTLRGKRLLVLAAEPVDEVGEAAADPGTLTGAVVATGAGHLRLLTVQPEGRAAMAADAWARGARLTAGERLGA